jgi:hypothetical protein
MLLITLDGSCGGSLNSTTNRNGSDNHPRVAVFIATTRRLLRKNGAEVVVLRPWVLHEEVGSLLKMALKLRIGTGHMRSINTIILGNSTKSALLADVLMLTRLLMETFSVKSSSSHCLGIVNLILEVPRNCLQSRGVRHHHRVIDPIQAQDDVDPVLHISPTHISCCPSPDGGMKWTR